MTEQLALDFNVSATQRHRRARKMAEIEEQPTLFASWSPNLDIHLHSTTEAIAQITGAEPERAHHWLAGIVGSVRPIKTRRVAFPTDKLDRLLHVRPPAQITLDAAAAAVGRALWADKLGLKPLAVRRERQRLLADSPRWPSGFRVKDAPWTAIATIVHLGLPLNVDPAARTLLRRKLEDAGAKIAAAGLAGSAVVIETSRPEVVESLGLPGLAYAGEPRTGTYKVPLLAAEPLLRQHVIDVPPELEKAIKKATAPVKPLRPADFSESFPYTLYGFQAADAGRAVRILETTGGVLLAGDMGSGKSQDADSPVLTPTGWRRIGDLRSGDRVMGRDGRPHAVTGVFRPGEKDMFDVVLSDGTRVRCSADHRWQLQRGGSGSPRVLRLEEFADDLRERSGAAKWIVPKTEVMNFGVQAPLPIDPYILGAWIGDGRCDGSGMTPQFCGVDEQIADEVRARLRPDLQLLEKAPAYAVRRWSFTTRKGVYRNPFIQALKGWGLAHRLSYEKFIPPEYLTASAEARLALLQGLMDTDGSPRPRGGGAVFVSTSRRLCEEVRELVWSLGGQSRMQVKIKEGTQYEYLGQMRDKRPAWQVSVNLPEGTVPFLLTRKTERYRAPAKGFNRRIQSVEPAGRHESVCITVDEPDQLYVTTGYTPVKNTTVSLGLADHMDIWPLLVVAPLSAFSTWERQMGEMGKKAYLATETPKKSWDAIENGDFDAIVISFDRLPAFTELIERMHFKGIVADEIQRIRTPGSKRSRALRALAASVPLRIGLSGTPLTNTVNDLLPLGAFLAPGEWRPRANEKDLDDMYPGDPTEAIAEHLGSLMVRRRMDDTGATLPTRNDHRIYIELTPEQRRALAELEAEAERAKEAGEFDDPNARFHAFAKLQKQRQIINSPAQAGIGGPNPKVTAAIKLARDFLSQGRKGVLFCADRTTFVELGKQLDAAGVGWVGIWGSTPPADRIKHEKMFHAGATAPNGHPTEVVVCTIQAGSESWSASPTATWLISTAYVYAPSTLAQMECRVYRLNSDVNGPDIEICYIHAQMPGGSLDDRMVEILQVKKELFAQVVDRQTFTDTTKVHYSMGDLVYLLTGKRDERLDAREADARAATAREEAKKDHAKRTLYGHKKRNADLKLDDGTQAQTLDEYRDLDRLLEAADEDDAFDATDLVGVAAELDDESFDANDDDFDTDDFDTDGVGASDSRDRDTA